MWEFVEHNDTSQTRWTWARISERGIAYQRSPAAYESFGKAVGSAMLHGFDCAQDKFRMIEAGEYACAH